MANTVQNPLVSVVIPVYNAERYVASTVESVIAQSHKNLEIIIVIDGSTDRSYEICQQFEDERIRYIVQENQGISATRNAGIRESKGAFIGFIDSDDTWQAEKVQRHLRHFEADTTLGVSFSYSALMDDQGRALGTYQKEGKDPSCFSDFYIRNVMGNGSAAVFRSEVFTGRDTDDLAFPPLDGFLTELKQAEDYEFWCRIAHKTKWKMACIPEPLINYRLYRGSLSSNLSLQRKYSFLAMAKIANFAPDQAEKWRCGAVAHVYWHQARTAASQNKPRVGTNAVKLAIWYEWRSINANHIMICFALLAALLLPEKPYLALQRRAGRVWGKFQDLKIRMHRSHSKHTPVGKKVPPARDLVKKPRAYVRKVALPNLFLVCHRHRFMNLNVAKNASTSLKYMMWQQESDSGQVGDPGSSHRHWGWKPDKGRVISVGDTKELVQYEDYLKFVVYRDPVSRFLSAYHNRVLYQNYPQEFFVGKRLEGMGLDQFIRVTESILKIKNHLHIDEHMRPQAWYYEPSDVDFIVPIEQLDDFLKVQFAIALTRNANRTVLPGIQATEQQKQKIAELYQCDYAIEPNWPPCPESSTDE